MQKTQSLSTLKSQFLCAQQTPTSISKLPSQFPQKTSFGGKQRDQMALKDLEPSKFGCLSQKSVLSSAGIFSHPSSSNLNPQRFEVASIDKKSHYHKNEISQVNQKNLMQIYRNEVIQQFDARKQSRVSVEKNQEQKSSVKERLKQQDSNIYQAVSSKRNDSSKIEKKINELKSQFNFGFKAQNQTKKSVNLNTEHDESQQHSKILDILSPKRNNLKLNLKEQKSPDQIVKTNLMTPSGVLSPSQQYAMNFQMHSQTTRSSQPFTQTLTNQRAKYTSNLCYKSLNANPRAENVYLKPETNDTQNNLAITQAQKIQKDNHYRTTDSKNVQQNNEKVSSKNYSANQAIISNQFTRSSENNNERQQQHLKQKDLQNEQRDYVLASKLDPIYSEVRESNHTLHTNSFLGHSGPSQKILSLIESEADTFCGGHANLTLATKVNSSFFSPNIQRSAQINIFSTQNQGEQQQHKLQKFSSKISQERSLLIQNGQQQEGQIILDSLKRKIDYSHYKDKNILILENSESRNEINQEQNLAFLSRERTFDQVQFSHDIADSSRKFETFKPIVAKTNSKSRSNSFIRGSPRRFLERDKSIECDQMLYSTHANLEEQRSSPSRQTAYFQNLMRESLGKMQQQQKRPFQLQEKEVEESKQRSYDPDESGLQDLDSSLLQSQSKIEQLKGQFKQLNSKFDQRNQDLFISPQTSNEINKFQDFSKMDNGNQNWQTLDFQLQRGIKERLIKMSNQNNGEQRFQTTPSSYLYRSKMANDLNNYESKCKQNGEEYSSSQNHFQTELKDDKVKEDSINQSWLQEQPREIKNSLPQGLKEEDSQISQKASHNMIGLKFSTIMNRKNGQEPYPSCQAINMSDSYQGNLTDTSVEIVSAQQEPPLASPKSASLRYNDSLNQTENEQLDFSQSQGRHDRLNFNAYQSSQRVFSKVSSSPKSYKNESSFLGEKSSLEQTKNRDIMIAELNQSLLNPESSSKSNSKFNNRINALREKMEQSSAKKKVQSSHQRGKVLNEESKWDRDCDESSTVQQEQNALSTTFAMDVNESFGKSNQDKRQENQLMSESETNLKMIETIESQGEQSPLRKFTLKNQFHGSSFRNAQTPPLIPSNPTPDYPSLQESKTIFQTLPNTRQQDSFESFYPGSMDTPAVAGARVEPQQDEYTLKLTDDKHTKILQEREKIRRIDEEMAKQQALLASLSSQVDTNY